MHKQFFLTSATLLTALLGGCSEEPAETQNASESTAPAAVAESKVEEAVAAPATSTEPAPSAATDGMITQAVIDQSIQTSRGAIKEFAGALQGELKAAIQAGGPSNAISVCNTEAPVITSRVSTAKGMNLSRVSLKNRNTGNAPEGWSESVLIKFEERLKAGEDAGKIDHNEIVEINGNTQFRYMKAIPTGEACLACHGSKISDNVKAKLNELYPADKATGYKLGELRGAFVVTRDL